MRVLQVLEMVKEAIESRYTDRATVTVKRAYQKSNKATSYHEVVIYRDQPCKISFFNAVTSQPPSEEATAAFAVRQQIKLFIAPECMIPPGSKITVTRDNVSRAYCQSGISAIFTNHQEITLELFQDWA